MKFATQRAHIRTVHPFPARMAPSIVWDALPDSGKPLRILDPMSGSGTTLVCAKLRGHHIVGCDSDPLAIIIAQSWCSDVAPEDLTRRAGIVLERAHALSRTLTKNQVYPRAADDETRRFIDFWFDSESRRELSALALCISRVRSHSERTLLWCAFSRMIITKVRGVSLAMDVSHSRPHKVYEIAPVRPFNAFLGSVRTVVRNCPFQSGERSTTLTEIFRGDARSLRVRSSSIDMIITSPPYLNAIDYLRGHKLSLVWMGYLVSEIRSLRSGSIGTEVSRNSVSNEMIHSAMEAMVRIESLDNRRLGMISRYVQDMNMVLAECKRVLKRSARAVFVIGNSALNAVYVQNSEALIQLAKYHRLNLVSKSIRPIEMQRRYLPPPESTKSGDKMQGRMKEEVILEFVLE